MKLKPVDHFLIGYGGAMMAIVVMGIVTAVTAAEAHPAATAADWLADPANAAAKDDALAKHTAGMGAAGWAGLIAAGMTVLAGLRFAAPFIPGLGPVWKVGVDFLWNIAQHKDAKQADAVQTKIADYATFAKPAIKTLREIYPETWAKLPNEIRMPLEALENA